MSVRHPVTPSERERRQRQWRESKRRERARALRKLQASTTCRVKVGPHGVCLGRIVEQIDRIGRLVFYCERCERRKAGVCQSCTRKVYGKVGWAKYCADCKRKAVADQNRKWVANNRERKNASVRAYRRRQRDALA